jgi:DNA-binding PadR family transcriptional regulator
MHPYRMQQLIKERGKDEVINVRQRASLYQTIERLQRDGLIAVQGTARAERRPERTIYALTDAGRAATVAWLRGMLAAPAREYPEFPAALAHLALLTPDDACQHLAARAAALTAELTRVDGQLALAASAIPRLFLVEGEYARALLATELAWVEALIEDLRTGRLTWSDAWLQAAATHLGAPAEPPDA